MADQLALPADLAILLGVPLDSPRMTLLIEAATAVVQGAAGGQRILEVEDDTADLTGTTDSWLDLPQRPVTAVTTAEIDGTAVTVGAAGSGGCTYRLRGSRMWRGDGWQTYCGEPSEVTVVYTHGWPAGAQQLQLARQAVLSLAKGVCTNPDGVARETIDDYTVAYEAAAALMDGSPYLRASLRRQYGRRGGLVRVGG